MKILRASIIYLTLVMTLSTPVIAKLCSSVWKREAVINDVMTGVIALPIFIPIHRINNKTRKAAECLISASRLQAGTGDDNDRQIVKKYHDRMKKMDPYLKPPPLDTFIGAAAKFENHYYKKNRCMPEPETEGYSGLLWIFRHPDL